MIVHLLFIALYFSFNVSFSPEYLNVILIIHCAVALLLKLNKGSEFITPLNVYFVSSIVISMGNLTVLGKVGTIFNKTNAYASVPDIPEGNFIWCIGCSCVFIGYELFSRFSFPSIALDFDKSRIKIIYRFLLFNGLFYQYVNSVLAFLGSLLKLFYLSGSIGIMFFARLWTRENNPKYRNYAFILYAIQTYLAFQHAYLRFEIILPTVVFFVGYFIGQGNLKALFSYRVLPFVILIGSFINIFTDLGKARGNFGVIYAQEYFSEQPEEDETKNEIYDEDENKYQAGFLDRSAILAQISNCVKLVKKNGFYNGTASYPVIVALVPRFLWPDKPPIMIGQWFAVETGTAFYNDRGHANNSINMTIPGECYLDFGWAGLILGCMFFGGFVSMLWNSIGFYASAYNLMGTLFGGYLLVLSFGGIGGDLQIVVTYTSLYLVFFTIKKIICEYFV